MLGHVHNSAAPLLPPDSQDGESEAAEGATQIVLSNAITMPIKRLSDSLRRTNQLIVSVHIARSIAVGFTVSMWTDRAICTSLTQTSSSG
jgi:hypothetical protein